MSFEFIDLNEYFLKIVIERLAALLIDHPHGGARTDNIILFIKKIG